MAGLAMREKLLIASSNTSPYSGFSSYHSKNRCSCTFSCTVLPLRSVPTSDPQSCQYHSTPA